VPHWFVIFFGACAFAAVAGPVLAFAAGAGVFNTNYPSYQPASILSEKESE